MKLQICASIIGKNIAEVKKSIKYAEDKGADLIEIRFDYHTEKLKLKDIRNLTSLPLIATNRPLMQGGLYRGKEEDRQEVLFNAAESGFNFIDLEIDTPKIEKTISNFRKKDVKLILSWHSFLPSTFDEIESKYMKMNILNADISKIVITAKTMKDNWTCLNFLYNTSTTAKIICFCMGPLGGVSRILSPLFGGAFTYASAIKGKEAAIGQLTVDETKKIYRLLGVNSEY